MKKTTVNSKILTILICLLTLLPSAAKAQVGFDAVSIEAYIKDHKQQRSLLLVRSTLEASNKLLHDYSGDANIGFRDINKELDKYTRVFDVIDILYQSLRTSLNVYSTYENVSDKVGDYRKMLNDFRKKCLERGNIMSIIRKTKCFRILERNAKISKTKRNFSRLYPTPQKFKKIDRLRRNEIHLKAVRTSS